MATKTPQSNIDSTAPINNLELASIKSLLAYTAYDKHVSEAVVRDVFSSRFGVNEVEKLPRKSFEDAIRFLVDIQIEMIH
ncbi:MAG: hypothetical protein WC521_03025 [Bdellovibrionales bacterium]|jgi:hypothetical protein